MPVGIREANKSLRMRKDLRVLSLASKVLGIGSMKRYWVMWLSAVLLGFPLGLYAGGHESLVDMAFNVLLVEMGMLMCYVFVAKRPKYVMTGLGFIFLSALAFTSGLTWVSGESFLESLCFFCVCSCFFYGLRDES